MPPESRNCLITGATGGIGMALARELARSGIKLVLTGRSEARLATLVDALPKASILETVAGDLLCSTDIENLAAIARRLNVDTLVNLSGVNELVWLEDQSGESVERMIALNLTAPIRLTQLLVPHFRASGCGLVVNVGSAFGAIGHPGYATYCASKFGLRGFSEALRRELFGTGVDVLYIAPRATATDMNAGATDALNDALGNKSDSPARVARVVLRAMQRRSKLTYVGWPEKLFIKLNQVFPGLVDRALRKQLATISQYARFEPQMKANRIMEME
jgi:short-subunit dehydrogenase